MTAYINECLSETVVTCPQEGASCVNTPGSFFCRCAEGFEFGESGICININECEREANCDANSHCQDLTPGYECNCDDGYTSDVDGCVDVNECLSGWPTCYGSNMFCENTMGSFECRCFEGYKRQDMSPDCYDINECADEPCGPNSYCDNLPGSHYCSCWYGYEPDVNGVCTNINECDLSYPMCDPFATCTDTEGSFICTCDEGFYQDGWQCLPEEIMGCDEEMASLLCAPYANCTLSIFSGEYDCFCLNGFTGDGLVLCDDVNECELEPGPCASTTTCENTFGSYKCECLTGYARDGQVCKDVNECLDDLHSCDLETTLCYNTEGSYLCNCRAGYDKTLEDDCMCQDINECVINPCGANTTCVNELGGYTCKCLEGFGGSCENCININECGMGSHNCHRDAHCTDTVGSFICECKQGFYGDGITSCEVEKPCAAGVDSCDVNAMCKDEFNGEYSCKCYPGYTESDNGTCIVDDVCGVLTKCSADATCTNIQGSYVCKCKSGFLGDGITCEAMPQGCGDGQACDPNAMCNDGECLCLDGYEGDGVAKDGVAGCIDIDECKADQPVCTDNAECINTPGLYLCQCKRGFVGDGEEVCVKGELIYSLCFISRPNDLSWRSRLPDIDECKLGEHNCPVDSKCSNKVGSYSCVCGDGYIYDKLTNNCTDVDECYMKQYICSPEAECLNTDGGYNCRCYDGYEGDGKVCTYIGANCSPDACLSEHSFCEDEINGEPMCLCQIGYRTTNSNPLTCTAVETSMELINLYADVDECAEKRPCSANAVCTNLPGTFGCQCNNGYKGNGKFCEDVDECLDDGTCAEGYLCENIPGSYKCSFIENCGCGSYGLCNENDPTLCVCNSGYHQVEFIPTNKCQDIDECIESPCEDTLYRVCFNIPGNFSCQCVRGSWNGTHCELEVCEKDNICHEKASCENVEGKAVCTCKPGYTGDGFVCTKVPAPCDENPCIDPLSVCSNTLDDAVCTCKAGYEEIEGTCSDIDECLFSSCGNNSVCENLPGFHRCLCLEGYRKVESACINIDECTEQTSNCDMAANCTDTEGGYVCTCKEGFFGDGSICSSETPCPDNAECDENAKCIAEGEEWYCQCNAGYTGDGFTCAGSNTLVAAVGFDHGLLR
ncbi:fibrillin-1-like [Watersipora subatra]|uniref:fibrillin-1-like n=1 Tax=Watersipora subatra TaxID=2589382 RepID=UPI00355BC861